MFPAFIAGPPQLTTIVHGELWENNILLAPDVCHVGDGVKVVDWKNAKIASGTLDLVIKFNLKCFRPFLSIIFHK